MKIGFGIDSGAASNRIPGWAEHRELQLLVDAGPTPMQAITLATRNAAELMQLNDRGVLTQGRRADFIVLTSDPSAAIDNSKTIGSVWRAGQPAGGSRAEFRP